MATTTTMMIMILITVLAGALRRLHLAALASASNWAID
jgi:hypothetical protein